MNIEMRATPGSRFRQEKEIVAENSANVAEYSAREIMAENSARLWLRFRQEKEMWLSIQQIVAEVSAREKEIWLGFQQIQGVANLISKHERGGKIREIGVT